jgi:hypothetical protein
VAARHVIACMKCDTFKAGGWGDMGQGLSAESLLRVGG